MSNPIIAPINNATLRDDSRSTEEIIMIEEEEEEDNERRKIEEEIKVTHHNETNITEDITIRRTTIREDDGKNSSHKPHISVVRLFFSTICFSGLQFGWALQIALLTPFILELGLSKTLITLVWLCGPIAGLLVQPIVGFLSDRCTSRLGRRRPFLLSGSILVILSMLLIPNSLDLGHLMGDKGNGSNPIAIWIAIIGFWILDISNNMLQGPTRALVADLASEQQQALGNATLTFWSGLGNILGYLTGFLNWSRFIPYFKTSVCSEACQNLRIAMLISICFLTITTLITLFVAREKRHVRRHHVEIHKRIETLPITKIESSSISSSNNIEENSLEIHSTTPIIEDNPTQPLLSTNPLNQGSISTEPLLTERENEEGQVQIIEEERISVSSSSSEKSQVQELGNHSWFNVWQGQSSKFGFLLSFFKLPKAMWRVCLVNFFSWFGWFCFLVYITDWVGENVFHGNSDNDSPLYPLYTEGVRFGSIGLAGFAFMSIITSLIVPKCCNSFGYKKVYFIGMLLLSILLSTTILVGNRILAIAVISLCGIPWAISNTIPFAIVANVASEEQKGIYMGILNIFVVIPQLLMSGVGPIISIASKGNVAWTLVIGGVSVFISACLVYFLIIPRVMTEKKKRRKRKSSVISVAENNERTVNQ